MPSNGVAVQRCVSASQLKAPTKSDDDVGLVTDAVEDDDALDGT